MSDVVEFDPEVACADNGNYFGMPFTPEEAALVLVSVPWDVTVSYGAGTAAAPAAIASASTQLDFYDAAFPGAWRRGIATWPVDDSIGQRSAQFRTMARRVIEALECGENIDKELLTAVNRASEQLNGEVYALTKQLLAQGKSVGLVGGDHSTPQGAIRAVAERHPGVGILHVDAHRDLREAYEGFECSHASIMYNVLKRIPEVGRLVQVGVRDYCETEQSMVENDPRVESFTAAELAEAAFRGRNWHDQCALIVEKLPAEVYVSFDIDGLDLPWCPHTGTPVPGGLTFAQAQYLLERVVRSGRRVVGFDLVEAVPAEDSEVDLAVAARVLFRLCGMVLESNSQLNI